MAASRVSLNTMKKIGTENTSGMTVSGTLQGELFGKGGQGKEGGRRENQWDHHAYNPRAYQIIFLSDNGDSIYAKYR